MKYLPKRSYVFSLVYGWAFPAMVPIFAMLFGILNTRTMWTVEYFFYSKNASDTYLFRHFNRIKLEAIVATSYKRHPFFAGISLILSYYMMYSMNSLTENQNWLCSSCYIVSSSFMAWWGSKLVPTMYGNTMAKEWTLLQSQLVILYNLALLMALLAQSNVYRNVIVILSFSLLACAGVLERAYVLFVLPLLGFPVNTVAGEKVYRQWYSLQFKMATISSWVLAGVIMSIYQHKLWG